MLILTTVKKTQFICVLIQTWHCVYCRLFPLRSFIDCESLTLQMMGRTLRGTRTRWAQTTRSHPEDKASQVRLTPCLSLLLCPHKYSHQRLIQPRSAPSASFDLGNCVCVFFHWGCLSSSCHIGFDGCLRCRTLGVRGRCYSFIQMFPAVLEKCLSESFCYCSWKRLLIQDLFLL